MLRRCSKTLLHTCFSFCLSDTEEPQIRTNWRFYSISSHTYLYNIWYYGHHPHLLACLCVRTPPLKILYCYNQHVLKDRLFYRNTIFSLKIRVTSLISSWSLYNLLHLHKADKTMPSLIRIKLHCYQQTWNADSDQDPPAYSGFCVRGCLCLLKLMRMCEYILL